MCSSALAHHESFLQTLSPCSGLHCTTLGAMRCACSANTHANPCLTWLNGVMCTCTPLTLVIVTCVQLHFLRVPRPPLQWYCRAVNDGEPAEPGCAWVNAVWERVCCLSLGSVLLLKYSRARWLHCFAEHCSAFALTWPHLKPSATIKQVFTRVFVQQHVQLFRLDIGVTSTSATPAPGGLQHLGSCSTCDCMFGAPLPCSASACPSSGSSSGCSSLMLSPS